MISNQELMLRVLPDIEYSVFETYEDGLLSMPPVLLLHGGTDGHIALDLKIKKYSVVDYLAARGFVVYTADLRGFGGSTKTSGIDVRVEVCAKDLRVVVRHMKEKWETQRVRLAGLSFGAQIAMAYAALWPDDVERLALVVPLYHQAGETMRGLVDKATKLSLRGVGYMRNTADASDLLPALQSVDQAVLSFYGPARNACCPKNPIGPLLEMVPTAEGTLPADRFAKGVRSPTLVVGAAHDLVAPARNAELLYKHLQADEKKWVLIPDGSHWLWLEKRAHTTMMEELATWFSPQDEVPF